MSNNLKLGRREFVKGIAGTVGTGVLASCAPQATSEPAAQATVAEQAATAVPATAAPATSAPTAAPAIKYGDKACVHHYMTGGFVGAGPEDDLIKQIQEDALRNEYGLNVDIQVESAAWADFDQLLNVRLETQGTDSVERDGNRVLNWIAEPGLIADIDTAIKEYGKNLLELFPQSGFSYFMREDGKYTAIPMMPGTGCNVEYVHIRRDWCDKVDRDIPTTIEELEEVLRLFKENNLGGDVTVPFTCQNGNWVSYNVLLGPYLWEPEEQFEMMERGENLERDISTAMIEPRLEMFQKWFQDGLLNSEWAVWKDQDVRDAAGKGILGCVSGGYWDTNGYLYDIEKSIDPSQDWVQIFPPVGLKDKPNSNRIVSTVAMERGLVVTSWASCPEAIIAFADWQNASWENYLTARYGIEGKHWEWGEGGWIEDLRSDPPNQEYSGMRVTPMAPKWRTQAALLPPAPGTEPKDPNINKRVLERHLHNRSQTHIPEAGEYPIITQIDHWVPYLFVESTKYDGDLKALREEYFANIVKGDLEVTAGVAEFWDRWFASGGEVRQREIQEQYAKYIAAHPEMKDPDIYASYDEWNTEIEYPPRPES